MYFYLLYTNDHLYCFSASELIIFKCKKYQYNLYIFIVYMFVLYVFKLYFLTNREPEQQHSLTLATVMPLDPTTGSN